MKVLEGQLLSPLLTNDYQVTICTCVEGIEGDDGGIQAHPYHMFIASLFHLLRN